LAVREPDAFRQQSKTTWDRDASNRQAIRVDRSL
jgi:hypothetical protein